MNTPVISIIMPARNASPYIDGAIRSVQAQTWADWELLVVDNDSSDGTAEMVRTFNDPRIILLHEPQRGVGYARNKGLIHMTGAFYCFLDADDLLPPDSLADRAALLLADPALHFADGGIEAFALDGSTPWTRTPDFQGQPMDELLALSGRCFVGNTWMIRRVPGPPPRFLPDMTHAEDLLFYLTIARQGNYASVGHPVLRYRVGHSSAMSDLRGLHQGYRDLVRAMRSLSPPPPEAVIARSWHRIRSIMFRTYLKQGKPRRALAAWREPLPMGTHP
ncbi:MAG: glycosyltransferase family A protein [Flavobacteriales bacterium]